MKLREVLKSEIGHYYEVREHDVSPSGKVSSRDMLISRSETQMRCLQPDLSYEKLIKGKWFIISKEEFEYDVTPLAPKKRIELPIEEMMIPSTHFMNRATERFGVEFESLRPFLRESLKEHFIVQNFEFYNVNYKSHDPSNIMICSKDFKKVLVMSPKGNRYVLVTCYNPLDPQYQAFQNWFQDHMEIIHELPSLNDYLYSKEA